MLQTAHMTRLMETHQAQMENLVELIQLQADSKAWDKETQKMIRQVNNHLVIVRQKVYAILVQNYELHEYPIPQLFVIFPINEAGGIGSSSFSTLLPDWVPRFTEKFRLFFLFAPTVGHLVQGADQVAKTVRSTAASMAQAVDFSDLRALEGADFRRLDTFLKNKDEDKILGNLYKVMTKEGSVFRHLQGWPENIPLQLK
ncbi:hypothetical protein BG000_008094 [Podila horticola]|nr:hypothetical protein BG000_008094 [Podila horticola]